MTNAHILTALHERRIDLANEIDHTQTRLRQMIADIAGLDTTIRLFDSDYQAQPVSCKDAPSYSDLTRRGDMARVILDLLRQADKPLTISEIAKAFIENRQLDIGDDRLLQIIKERVGRTLRKQRPRGLVRSEQGTRREVLWTSNT